MAFGTRAAAALSTPVSTVAFFASPLSRELEPQPASAVAAITAVAMTCDARARFMILPPESVRVPQSFHRGHAAARSEERVSGQQERRAPDLPVGAPAHHALLLQV